jgi:hypothetical protein
MAKARTEDCGLTIPLPDLGFLASLAQYSWTIGEELPVVINWTGDQSSIKHYMEKGRVYQAAESEYALEESKLAGPDETTLEIISSSFQKWSDALGGKVVFNYVNELTDNKGISITVPDPYHVINDLHKMGGYSAIDPRGLKIEHAVIVLPSDYASILASGKYDGFAYHVDELVTHEIGHALGMQIHTHDIPELAKVIGSAKWPDHCSIMDYNRLVDGSVSSRCFAASGGNSYVCSAFVNNTAPGLVDTAIFNARIKAEQMALKQQLEERGAVLEAAASKVQAEEVEFWTDSIKGQGKSFVCAFVDTMVQHYLVPTLIDRRFTNRNAEAIGKAVSTAVKAAAYGVPQALLAETLSFAFDKALEKTGMRQLGGSISLGISASTAAFTGSVFKTGVNFSSAYVGEMAARKVLQKLPKVRGAEKAL